MNLKIRGLNIVVENKNLGYSMTNEAQKEFCQYHEIPYEENQIGVVTTARGYVHGLMLRTFAEIGTCNNWRKMHGLPLIRRRSRR